MADVSDPVIAQAYEDVRSDKSETTWLRLDYEVCYAGPTSYFMILQCECSTSRRNRGNIRDAVLGSLSYSALAHHLWSHGLPLFPARTVRQGGTLLNPCHSFCRDSSCKTASIIMKTGSIINSSILSLQFCDSLSETLHSQQSRVLEGPRPPPILFARAATLALQPGDVSGRARI
ncbi:hypothetical protein ARMSODRAFT_199698 [Armillaria solidipes]|uniref:Uncharacterized protein n=1 Tax=Armillaria solidipes TaxID=1076256 RepID=A0A2H3BGU8_9AGAR|nr:hypothetical protein ARMSODRAFT_199698 [Armillaria solidipes]